MDFISLLGPILPLVTNPAFGLTVTVLFGVSEALASIPAVKANSVFQLISNLLKSISGKAK